MIISNKSTDQVLSGQYLMHNHFMSYMYVVHSYTQCVGLGYTTYIYMNDSLWNSHSNNNYRKTSNKSCTLAGNKIVDHPDVVGDAPTTSSL